MSLAKDKESLGLKTKLRNFSITSKALLLTFILSNVVWILLYGITYSKLDKTHMSSLDSIEDSLKQASEVELQFLTEPSIFKVDLDTNKVIIDTGNIYYNSYLVSVLECSPGEKYYYTGTHYNYAKQYSIIVTDNHGKVLLKDLGREEEETRAAIEIDYEFTIPDNGTRLYIQSYGNPIMVKKLSCMDVASVTETLELNKMPCYDNVVRNIQRIGDGMVYPTQSLDAFREAYKKGFRILLCNLTFTSDDIPVCNHDSYLNQYYKNVYDAEGNLVSTDAPIYFSQNTYETLSQYSYGAVGYPLLKFTDMLKLVRQLGVELYVEVKVMNEQQAKIACDLVKQYGLIDKTSWCGTLDYMQWVVNNIETARVATMPVTITDGVIADLNSLKTGKNKVFIFGWDTTVLTEEIVEKLIENEIAFEQGTPKTPQEVIDYFNRGEAYYYCTGIETEGFIAGKVLLEAALKNES